MVTGKYFRNKKNGQIYTLLHTAQDMTDYDANYGRMYVVYQDSIGVVYLRSEYNFECKFEELSLEDVLNITAEQ